MRWSNLKTNIIYPERRTQNTITIVLHTRNRKIIEKILDELLEIRRRYPIDIVK